MDEHQPKYNWRETWPSQNRQDYIGLDGEEVVGRIQLEQTTSKYKVGLWRWNVSSSWLARQRSKLPQGWAETAREAMRLAEEHYEKLKQRHRR